MKKYKKWDQNFDQKCEIWSNQVKLRMSKQKGPSILVISKHSINNMEQFQFAKLTVNCFGVLIPLDKGNNISIFQDIPTCSFGKKRQQSL